MYINILLILFYCIRLHKLYIIIIIIIIKQQAAIKTQGAAGPSGIDAYVWRRFCSSFKGASRTDLCNALAGVARHLFILKVYRPLWHVV